MAKQKNRVINSDKEQAECLRCGTVWTPRYKNPKACAKCKSNLWNTSREELADGRTKGRDKVEVPRDQFEGLCRLQCTKLEVCEFFGITDKTLERWCKETYDGAGFSEVFELKRTHGKIALRRNMMQMAQTTPSVAIFLAKNWLGMSDKQEVDHSGAISVVGTGYPQTKKYPRLKKSDKK